MYGDGDGNGDGTMMMMMLMLMMGMVMRSAMWCGKSVVMPTVAARVPIK